MFAQYPVLDKVCHYFLVGVVVILAIMFLISLLRLVLGPTVADRLMSVNILGGMVIVAIALLALMMKESYLVDICIVYALISFLAVVILSQIYIGVFRERNQREQKNQEEQQKLQEQERLRNRVQKEERDGNR